MEKVIFILGPTGVGKSNMAVNLAHVFGGEIISADSVQLYKGFDIGSAKVSAEEMAGVPHHLIDICNPNDYFTVSDFVDMTRQKITEVTSRNKLPIIVGGTGLYVNSLLGGYNFGGTEKHDDFRLKIKQEIEEQGHLAVWQKLKDLNSVIAEKIEPNNTNRLIRGLEIATYGQEQTENKPMYDYKLFALNLDRTVLYDRINKRVDKMIDAGLVKEVKLLFKNGARKDSQPMKAIGYKEVVDFLDGNTDEKTMIDLIKQHTRNYAKRQLTYLRGLEKKYDLNFINADENAEQNITNMIKGWL